MGKIRRGIVVCDRHVPEHDPGVQRALESYLADLSLDYFIDLGDFLDLAAISKYNENYPGAAAETVSNEFEAGRQVLDRTIQAIRKKNPRCRYILLQGNHEYRAVRWGQKYPKVADLANIPANLELKSRKIEWLRNWECGEMFIVGDAIFTHGRYTNKHHAFKHADLYGGHVYYGHVHDCQHFTKKLVGQGRNVSATSLGCLCRMDPGYMQGAPDNWQHAFGEFWFFPDGTHQMATVKINKGRFIGPTTGKVYSSKR